MSGLAVSMKIPTPGMVTGGCLCGGVRYQIDFSKDHDWKRGPSTCQCTMCRKNCGSLVYMFHTVTASEITWTSQTTYAEYNSSPGCHRSFCNKCGSPIAWTDRSINTDIAIAVGTVDEEFLVGKRDTEDKPQDGFGLALANLEADHLYVRNEIPGVTDVLTATGTKFWEGHKEGAMTKTGEQE